MVNDYCPALIASTGLRLAADEAGMMPESKPTTNEMPNPITTFFSDNTKLKSSVAALTYQAGALFHADEHYIGDAKAPHQNREAPDNPAHKVHHIDSFVNHLSK